MLLLLLVACSPTNQHKALDPDTGDSTTALAGLPTVWIDTRDVRVDDDELWDDDGRAWTTVDAEVIDTDGSRWSGQAGLHIRGNSSAWGYEKKSYAFETRDKDNEDADVALLGLPAEEDWVLHGPFSDKTLMRNVLMYGWSNRIGRYAARTRFVELYLEDGGDTLDEDDYHGIYVLMEKIKRDKNRVDITELESQDESEPAISGGYLLKKDWYEEEDPNTYVRTATYEDVLLLADPDPNAITSAQRAWLRDWLGAFETALAGSAFADPTAGYAAYIDVDSFIDHHLLVELGRNVDGYVLSTWLHKDQNGPLKMGPIWDYNGALGNADYFESWDPEGWHYENPEFPADNPNAYHWYTRLFQDPAFTARYAERWAELRADPLSTERLLADIQVNANLLETAAPRNFERWPVLGEYVWPNDAGAEDRHSYAEEISYLESWITARTAWMDTAVLDL